MEIRREIKQMVETQIAIFASSQLFQFLVQGQADSAAYDRFLSHLFKTHIQAAKRLAFLYAIAPPSSSSTIKGQLLAELGLGEGHPPPSSSLLQLMNAVGYDSTTLAHWMVDAYQEIHRLLSDPPLYPKMRSLGLHLFLETCSFEWMLSRLATRMGDFLMTHRKVDRTDLGWFYFRPTRGIAEERDELETIAAYVGTLAIPPEEVEVVLKNTFSGNLFLKRYFPSDINLLSDPHPEK